MSPDNTPKDTFLEILYNGGIDKQATNEFEQQAVHAEHNQSLQQLHDAIAAFTRKPSSDSINDLAAALTTCDTTFTNKMRWLLADYDDPHDCTTLLAQEIADDEIWRSTTINSLVPGSNTQPMQPESIATKLNKLIKKYDIDSVEKTVEVSSVLNNNFATEDITDSFPIVSARYQQRLERRRTIGRNVLDVVKVSAGAALAILATRKFGRSR